MISYGNIYPVKNDNVNIRKIKDKNILFDPVSGSMAKISDFAIRILDLCRGYMNIEQIHKFLELNKLDFKISDLYDFLDVLSKKNFLNLVDKYKTNDRRILLINPPFPYKHERYNTYYYTPPLGLIQIAAELEKNNYKVEIFDMAVLNLTPSDVNNYIENLEYKPDIIGVSCNMTFTYPNALRICKNIKDKFINIPIVMGGNHATFCCEEILKNESSIDFITLYEGEYTTVELYNLITQGSDNFSECRGIAFRNFNGEVIKTEKREKIKNLDELSFPAYHLIQMELYNKSMQGIVMTSRGCPHKCVYCSTAKFNGNVVYRSVDSIINHIKFLINKYSLSHITFGDDAFTINKKRVMEICNKLKKENLSITWSCNTRVDMVDHEILSAIKEAGCTSILFGIESMSQKVLDTVSKRFNIEQVKNAISMAKKLGIKVKQNYIIGLPYETNESLEEMREFVKQSNPEEIEYCILCLFPGTDLYIKAEEFGIKNFNLSWDKLHLIQPSVETEWLNREDIMKNYLINWVKA